MRFTCPKFMNKKKEFFRFDVFKQRELYLIYFGSCLHRITAKLEFDVITIIIDSYLFHIDQSNWWRFNMSCEIPRKPVLLALMFFMVVM